MNLEKALKDYGNMGPKAREEDMYAAAAMGRMAFIQSEEMQVLSYGGFLRMQLRVLKKRWWLLQCLVLAGLWIIYPSIDGGVVRPQDAWGGGNVVCYSFNTGAVAKPDRSGHGGGSGRLLFFKADLCGPDAFVWHCRCFYDHCFSGRSVHDFKACPDRTADPVPFSYDSDSMYLFWIFMRQQIFFRRRCCGTLSHLERGVVACPFK